MTGLSQFALLRAFRAATGLPPHAYLNQVRVRRARLLLDDGVPAADVAGQVGFADQAHLTRHFKRVVGVPPAAYQRERLQPAASARYAAGGKNVQDRARAGRLDCRHVRADPRASAS